MWRLKTKTAAALLAALAASGAFAITATKEYVDRKDGETAQASTNLVAAATNQIAVAVAAKADAAPTIQTTIGGVSTNETGRVVYSNVSLIIREVPAANGQRQLRVIRKND